MTLADTLLYMYVCEGERGGWEGEEGKWREGGQGRSYCEAHVYTLQQEMYYTIILCIILNVNYTIGIVLRYRNVRIF